MKIAICIDFFDNSGRIADSLGDANYYFIYDANNERLHDKITNHFRHSKGSEIFGAQLLIKRGVDIVVCGRCEPNAESLLKEAGIKIIEEISNNPSAFLVKFYREYRKESKVSELVN